MAGRVGILWTVEVGETLGLNLKLGHGGRVSRVGMARYVGLIRMGVERAHKRGLFAMGRKGKG